MNQGKRGFSRNATESSDLRPVRKRFFASEKEQVLSVPPVDLRSVPKFPPNINGAKSMVAEALPPICRPLLIDVARSTLARNRSGKQHERRQPAQICDVAARTLSGKVLGNLEVKRQIKAPYGRERLLEVGGQKVLHRDAQLAARDPGPIDAEYAINTTLGTDGKPRTGAAADIHDRANRNAL